MLTAVRGWILFSTLLVGGGWILSAIHQLNRAGYLTIFALAATWTVVWRQKAAKPSHKQTCRFWRRFIRRFCRPAPFLFLLLALSCFIGGALYPSANADTNAYRLPRTLHWLGAEHWHWIRTLDLRLNIVGCGFEWLAAPLVLFTRSDRLFFLINIASYALLPGLVFSVFTRLNVRPRVAWWWMWLLPAGWCYIFQAGSTVNDSLAAVYALASVDLALRARQRRCVTDLWLSMLAAALTTGVKQTDIPLAALWLIAAWPSLRLAIAWPKTTTLLAGVSLLVSIVPLTIFNIKYCGNWQGLPHDSPNVWIGGSPFWRVAGNLFCIPLQNFALPISPWSGEWNDMMRRFLSTPFGSHFAFFERFGSLGGGISEYNAGLGLGLCSLAMISILGARACQPDSPAADVPSQDRKVPVLLRITPWLLLLVFMAELTTFENARLLSAYYPFFFPLFLAGSRQGRLVRRKWWGALAISSMLFAGAVLVISRERPLFPAQTITGKLSSAHPQSGFLAKLSRTYRWRSKLEVQQDFAKKLPADARTIGYATTIDDLEPALWLPLGSRRVERILPEDTIQTLAREKIDYAFVDNYYLDVVVHDTIGHWNSEHHATLVDSLVLQRSTGNGVTEPGGIYLVRLQNPIPPD